MKNVTTQKVNRPLLLLLFAVLGLNTSYQMTVSTVSMSSFDKVRRDEQAPNVTMEQTSIWKGDVEIPVLLLKKKVRTRNGEETKVYARYSEKEFYQAAKLKKVDSDNNETEVCEDCWVNGQDVEVGVGIESEVLNHATWMNSLDLAKNIEKGVDGLAGKLRRERSKKKFDADHTPARTAQELELQKKIFDCEWPEGTTQESKDVVPLKGDDKLECARKRIAYLSDRFDQKDQFGRKINKELINRFKKMTDAHLSRCLSNPKIREESNCLQLAEEIRDELLGSGEESIHRLGHDLELKIVNGFSNIESSKVMQRLGQLQGCMTSSETLAVRSGNFMTMQSCQNQLNQLHQYYEASQLRRQQYLSQMSMDPEMGFNALAGINQDSLLNSRIEEAFLRAANPRGYNSMRMGGMNPLMMRGMNPLMMRGMNPMMMNGYNPLMMQRMGMPMPYGYQSQLFNPMMMNRPLMYPGTPGIVPGMPYPGQPLLGGYINGGLAINGGLGFNSGILPGGTLGYGNPYFNGPGSLYGGVMRQAPVYPYQNFQQPFVGGGFNFGIR